jgi:hypothetical protein
MRLVFDHKHGRYDNENNLPLIYVECVRENETTRELFETGWLPWGDRWYQTRSARLRSGRISSRRKKELSAITIKEGLSDTENAEWVKRFGLTTGWAAYEKYGVPYTFSFDDRFWGLAKIYDDQFLYCLMSTDQYPESYGTLSYYYLMNKFGGDFEYLYITDYYDEFKYKSQLFGFEYWTGFEWVKKQ